MGFLEGMTSAAHLSLATHLMHQKYGGLVRFSFPFYKQLHLMYTLGSCIKYRTISGAQDWCLGRVHKMNQASIVVQKMDLKADPIVIEDIRFASIPQLVFFPEVHLKLRLAGHVCEPVLVTTMSSVLENIIIYRKGMADIYIVVEALNNNVPVFLSESLFAGSTAVAEAVKTTLLSQSVSDALDVLADTRIQTFAYPHQIYQFRHMLADAFQSTLRSSKGRRLHMAFSFPASNVCARALFHVVHRHGVNVCSKVGSNKVSRLVGNSTIRTVSTPGATIEVKINRTNVLYEFLGTYRIILCTHSDCFTSYFEVCK